MRWPASEEAGAPREERRGLPPVILENYPSLLPLILILGTLWVVSLFNYPLFHSLVEGLAIMGALGVFIVGWHSRRYLDNGFLAFIGIAYLFVGAVDMFHTLSYKGINIFPDTGADIPTQLWIAGRYLQALSLLLAFRFLRRPVPYRLLLSAYLAVTGLILGLVFWTDIFPHCFVEEIGLTPFKKVSEYLISGFLAGGVLLLHRNRERFDSTVYRYLAVSFLFGIASELSFTQYASVYGAFNLLGHQLRVVSFYAMYKAIVETGLLKPYSLLFRNLKLQEDQLRLDNAKLLSLQKELANKNRDLERANGLKNEFVGMVAHDLRTPLSVVHWYTQLLLERHSDSLGKEPGDILARIDKSSDFMLSLVDDLLDIAAIEAGTLRLDRRETDLAALVRENVLVNQPLAGLKGVTLHFQEAGALPGVMVDPRRMEQVLNNLIANAVKYAPPGSSVEVRLAREMDRAVISVSDQGPGIPHADRDRVFKAFETARQAQAGGEKSTGLGLAIVRRIVEAHGGSVWLESVPAQGSIFFVGLPLPNVGGATGPEEDLG